MIVIVTVYKSNNYGSYLQAKALYTILKQYDKDVFFLDFCQRKYHIIKGIVSSIVKMYGVKRLKRTFQNFQYWRKLPSVTLNEIGNRDDITYVLGSDEIWNVKKKGMLYPQFWGVNLKGKLLSYAVSSNNSKYEDIIESGFHKRLNDFKSIGVRDYTTFETISKLTNNPVSVVLDPTLLFDADFYAKQINKINIPYDYVAAYTLSDKGYAREIEALRCIFTSKNLKIVSVGIWKYWCDSYIINEDFNPYLEYVDAKYVVTNTFHGTAFAINFEKQFVVFSQNNQKITDLLNQFGLGNRNIFGKSQDEILNILNQKIDYTRIHDIKNEMRRKSITFIEDSLK